MPLGGINITQGCDVTFLINSSEMTANKGRAILSHLHTLTNCEWVHY